MTEYIDDIESDMSVFHRVDDIYGMEAPRFFRFAERLTAYQGVLAARIAQDEERSGGGMTSRGGEPVRRVAPTREAISADPALGSLVSWGTS